MIHCPTISSNPWECPGRDTAQPCSSSGAQPQASQHQDVESQLSTGMGPCGSEPFFLVCSRERGGGQGQSTHPAGTRAVLPLPGPQLGSGCPTGDSPAPPPAPTGTRACWLPWPIAYREMSPQAENSPAEPCQGTSTHCYSCSAWGRAIL